MLHVCWLFFRLKEKGGVRRRRCRSHRQERRRHSHGVWSRELGALDSLQLSQQYTPVARCRRGPCQLLGLDPSTKLLYGISAAAQLRSLPGTVESSRRSCAPVSLSWPGLWRAANKEGTECRHQAPKFVPQVPRELPAPVKGRRRWRNCAAATSEHLRPPLRLGDIFMIFGPFTQV
ncbi:unnamed protein product [Scytosiphon promiscuus]